MVRHFVQWLPAQSLKDNDGKHWQPTGSKRVIFNNVKEIASALKGWLSLILREAVADGDRLLFVDMVESLDNFESENCETCVLFDNALQEMAIRSWQLTPLMVHI